MRATSWLLGVGYLISTCVGCATWAPTGDQPPSIQPGIRTAALSSESVAIETITIRLSSEQATRLEELWRTSDEQILSASQRLALDRNGIRVGKLAVVPPLLETWVREIGERQSLDTMEQTGLTADVTSSSQHWRCRANNTKEIPIRNLQTETIPLFYFEESLKGKHLVAPRFFFKMSAKPDDNFSAQIRLSPEIEHGEARNRVIVRESALRNVSERESMIFPELAIQQKLNRGDILVLGPTSERRGLGSDLFHSLTQDGIYEPVLLLVRHSQSGVDENFAPSDVKTKKK